LTIDHDDGHGEACGGGVAGAGHDLPRAQGTYSDADADADAVATAAAAMPCWMFLRYQLRLQY
jgi:hypothetical protein